MDFSSLSRINQTDGRTPHRCPGYVREEITLATTTLDSAVVAHDAPSASERCLICHEVVDVREKFRCECGDLAPGSRHTIKCQACKFWSHSDCVLNANHEFTCWLCMRPKAPAEEEEETRASGSSFMFGPRTHPPFLPSFLPTEEEDRLSPLLFGPRTPTEDSEEEDMNIETWTSGSPLLFGPRTLTEDSEEEDMNIETWTSGSPLLFGSRTPTEDSEEEDMNIETWATGSPPSKRYNNNLFGPGRFRDYSYKRSVPQAKIASMQTGGSPRTHAVASYAESLKTPAKPDASSSLEKLVMQPGLLPSSLRRRASLALEEAIKAIEQEAEDEIIMPRRFEPLETLRQLAVTGPASCLESINLQWQFHP
ncbi:hypothetical protein MSAN_01163300 [Mycena sanguinolenta]|uniref:Uncharacterized protein n=1 Tax=Mycena sanguinolenta TaxID=230812 RepID=A0A8H6YHG6_9AGAR|nr:hypothetical protein MSAN_01163300 [Mycena sanguinolenta]